MSQDGTSAGAFLEAAVVPRDTWHTSGTLNEAEAILAAHPGVAKHEIFTAAALGDDVAVAHFLAGDASLATARGGPRGWDPLTYLCFSRYLRLDPARSGGFVRAAEALLDAGADPNTGWHETRHQPEPCWESVLYGAAGIAHHEALTRLLLARGADPNDGETPYHAAESYDMGVLRALVESGKLSDDGLTTLLLRKTDTHHGAGVAYLLEHGADPNRLSFWRKTALHNALISDNAIEVIQSLLDHGADPNLPGDSGHGRRGAVRTGTSIAARRGRRDVLEALEGRGMPVVLEGVDRLVAACARDDSAAIRAIADAEPGLVAALVAEGGELLAEFAGNGNTRGVGHLLDLGVGIAAPYALGDSYFGVAPGSTALHVAAWRARPETVKLFLARGAPVDLRDGHGRTPLMLAVKACVDSYWMNRRSPDSVASLLDAGASTEGVPFPCGYPEVDSLLARRTPPGRGHVP
ncbi:MAG: ankyrin repeat domain-containing protein [Isosphaeraceae bacterium]